MFAHAINPILNVSSFQESVEWFEKLGWTRSWAWGSPPRFGAVCSGRCEIFLCEGAQGGRGASPSRKTNEQASATHYYSIAVMRSRS